MNHIVLSLFYFITALPGNILGWPIYVHSKLYSLYMQRKALKKSNVKIQAIDVVASNKVYIYIIYVFIINLVGWWIPNLSCSVVP